jgi:hypothetical protein
MDQGPLAIEQIDSGARFLAEVEKKIPVIAAFWLKASEEGWWYFYVASDEFNDKSFDEGYAEVLRVAREMGDPNFDPFRVNLIRASHPLAKAALDRLKLFPGSRIATRLRQTTFGGAGAEEVYIYPTMITVE